MKLLKYLLIIVLAFVFVSESFSQDRIWVDGYIKKDGTYVKGHYRTKPDGDPYNNYSFPGNYNPNTGKITTGNPDTYLRNYFKEKYTPEIRTDYNYDFDIDLDNFDIDFNDYDIDLDSYDNDLNNVDINLNDYNLDLDDYENDLNDFNIDLDDYDNYDSEIDW